MTRMFRLLTSLVLAALLAWCAPVVAGCQLEKVASLHVSIIRNRIFVPGSIDGHPVKFLIDTDMRSLVLPDAARRFDLSTMLGARLQPVIYTDEVSRGPIKVRDLVLDGTSFHDQVFHVVGKPDNFGTPDAVATLGFDFLGRYDVDIDLTKGVIELLRPEACENANLAVWTDRYNVLDMKPGFEGNLFNAKINGRELLATLDSANPETSLNIAAAASLGVTSSSEDSVTLPDHKDLLSNFPFPVWRGRFEEVQLDQETIKPANIPVYHFPPPLETERPYGSTIGRELSLGVDFLAAHHVLISYSQGKIYFSHIAGKSFLSPWANYTIAYARIRESYGEAMRDPQFDKIRGLVDLTEGFGGTEPECSSAALPSAADRDTIRKWSELRDGYVRELKSLAIPAEITRAEKTLIAEYSKMIFSGSDQVSGLIADLSDGKLNYCQFTTAEQDAVKATERKTRALLRPFAGTASIAPFPYFAPNYNDRPAPVPPPAGPPVIAVNPRSTH